MLARTEGVLRNPHPEEFLSSVAHMFHVVRTALMAVVIISVMLVLALIISSPILIFAYELYQGEANIPMFLVVVMMLWTIIPRQKSVRRALNNELARYAPALTGPSPVEW